MKKILVIGGANGIGLAIATELVNRPTTEKVYVVDKAPLQEEYQRDKIEGFQFDLTEKGYSFFDQLQDIDALMITAVCCGQQSWVTAMPCT